MKKTIATIAAALIACGAGYAEDELGFSITLDFVAGTPYTDSITSASFKNPTPILVDQVGYSPLVANASDFGASSQRGTQSQDLTNTNYSKHLFIAGYNIGKSANSTDVTYTFNIVAGCDFSLKSLDFVLFTSTSTGQARYDSNDADGAPTVTYTAAVGGSGISKQTATGTETLAATSVASHSVPDTAAYSFAADDVITTGSGGLVTAHFNGLELQAGKAYTIGLTLERASGPDGFFVGIGGVRVNGTIPEPATATLSLLALAGLAARRRRK